MCSTDISPLAALVLQSDETYCISPQSQVNKSTSRVRSEHSGSVHKMTKLLNWDNPPLPSNLQQTVSYGSEKGASHWLAVLPLTEGYMCIQGCFQGLHQSMGMDGHCHTFALQLWKKFSIEHAFSCHCGGLPIMTSGMSLLKSLQRSIWVYQ